MKKITDMKWFEYVKKPEYIFLTIASVFGLIAVFMIPPGWNSDEYQHFFRVEQLTDGVLLAVDENGERSGHVGGFINRGVAELLWEYGFENEEARENPSSPLQIWRGGIERAPEEERVYISFNGSAVYPPVTYLPQIIGNATGRVLGLPVYGSFLLARLAGLVFYIASIFMAIKLLPRGKWILLAISILATSVVQATALGADAVTFSIVSLFIAYTLHLATVKEELKLKKLSVLWVITIAMGLVKPTYIALIPLVGVLFIDKKNRKLKTIIAITVGVLVAVAIAGIWLKLTSYVGTNGGPESDRGLQLQHILGDPLGYVVTLARTYLGVVPGGYWNKFYEIAFTNFVWDTVRISLGYLVLTIIALTMSLGISDKVRTVKERTNGWLANTLMIGSFLATFLLINTALYLYFTPVGDNVVVGVQARYIFPFLILLMLPFQNFYKNQRSAKVVVVGILTLVLTVSFIGIYKIIYIV